jgi:hypothetical protein
VFYSFSPPVTILSQAWCYIPVIPALGRLRQKNHEFKARLFFIKDLVSEKNLKDFYGLSFFLKICTSVYALMCENIFK